MNRIGIAAISILAMVATSAGALALGSGGMAVQGAAGKVARSPAGYPFPDELARLAGSPGHLTMAVKFVEFTAAGQPVLSADQVRGVIRGVNQLYSPCNLHFRVEAYEPADPRRFGLAFHLTSMHQLNPVRGPFDSPSMLVITNTGSWDHGAMGAANAWTAMPGESPAGAVLEGPVASNFNIVAHEIGHYLGLDHVTDTDDLMNPIIYSFSTKLTREQCGEVRQTAQSARLAVLR